MSTTLVTVAQAAAELGIAHRTVANLCAEHGLGTLVNSRLRLLSRAEVKRLAKLKRPVGNPNFGPEFRAGKKSFQNRV